MPKFYCPYCSPKYPVHKQRADGIMVCGQCGDPLVKVKLIKPTQIFAFIAAAAFITPLIVRGIYVGVVFIVMKLAPLTPSQRMVALGKDYPHRPNGDFELVGLSVFHLVL